MYLALKRLLSPRANVGGFAAIVEQIARACGVRGSTTPWLLSIATTAIVGAAATWLLSRYGHLAAAKLLANAHYQKGRAEEASVKYHALMDMLEAASTDEAEISAGKG